MEAPQPGTRVHQIVQQHPSLRVQDLIYSKVRAVPLVNGCHQVVADPGKGFFAAVIIIYHAGRAAGIGINDQLAAGFYCLQPVHFGFVMVKGQAYPRIVGQVGGNITLRQFNFAILYILRMDKLNLINQIQFT